uniref:glutathione S-transferase theta-3-like n=1 Tax=Centroberyx gerrardi TaxID=166262 RepID=UPI003AAC84F2
DAILKYLVTKYNLPEHWYPRQPERRARVDEYTVLVPRLSGSPVDQDKVGGPLSELGGTLDKLESMFLRRQPFLCGDDITVADLLAVCELMQKQKQSESGFSAVGLNQV